MATLDQIKTARDSGYSDDEIYSYLGSSDERFVQAKDAGYQLDEVIQYLGAQEPEAPVKEDTFSDDWSGFVANMRIAGNRLGQGVDIARIEQVQGWKKEAEASKEILDTLESKDPNESLSKATPLLGSTGAGAAWTLSQDREKYLNGEVTPFYQSFIDSARKRYERTQKTFEEGAATVPEFAASIVEKEKRVNELTPQLSAEMTKLNQSEGAEFWKTFAKNPVESLSNVIASSAVVGVPAVVGGAVGSLAGPAGTAAGAAYGSYITEVSQSVLQSLRESGVDLTDTEKLQAGLGDPIIMQNARQVAESRGVAVATFDALTAGLAGRFIGPVLKETAPAVSAVLKASAKEVGMQMTGGALGETTAQLMAAEKLSGKEIALEALGEIGSGVTETISNLRESGAPLTAEAIKGGGEQKSEQSNETQSVPDPEGTVQDRDEQRETIGTGEVRTDDAETSLPTASEGSRESGQRGEVPSGDSPAPVTETETGDLAAEQGPLSGAAPESPAVKPTADDAAKSFMPFFDGAVEFARSKGALDPESAVSEAMVELSGQVEEGKTTLEDPKSLLFKATERRAIRQQEAERTQKRGGGRVDVTDPTEITSPVNEGPRAAAIAEEDFNEVDKFIETLPENEKRVTKFFKDNKKDDGSRMTDKDAAAALGLSEGTVGNIKSKAMNKVRDFITKNELGKMGRPGAAAANEVLGQYEVSRFGKRLMEDVSIDTDISQGENQFEFAPAGMYKAVTNEETAARAREFIDNRTVDGNVTEQAIEDVMDEDVPMQFEERVAVGLILTKRINDQYLKVKDSNPDAARLILQKAIDLRDAITGFGTRLGRGAQAFAMWNRLTLDGMLSDMQKSNGGNPLTTEQINEVAEIHSDLVKAQEELSNREQQLEGEAATQAGQDALEQLKADPEADPMVLSLLERIVKKLEGEADKARKRLRARWANTNALVDPTMYYDLSIIGAYHIANGIRKLSAWKAKMVSEFGDVLEPHLDKVWSLSNSELDKQVDGAGGTAKQKQATKKLVRRATSKQIAAGIKDRLTEGASIDQLRSYIQKLALAIVKESKNKIDLEGLTQKLHAIIEPLVPGITDRQVMDLFSGYGDFKALDKDASKVALRERKGEAQSASKLQDLKAGKMPSKTGVERQLPTDKKRRMDKEINELKKKVRVLVSDPAKQLKSTLDGIKTRIKNQIVDFAAEFELGVKPPEKTQVDYDAEAEAYQVVRDRLKDTLNKLDDTKISEAERVKIAEKSIKRSIEEYERRIKNGETRKDKGSKLSTPELDALKSRRDALKAELDELISADEALQEEREFDRLMDGASKAEKELLMHGPPKPESAASKDTELVAAARKRLQEARQALAASRQSSPEAKQKQIDSAIASIQKSISSYDARITAGDTSVATKGEKATTPELERLRAERAAMAKYLGELRRAEKPKADPEMTAIKAAKTRALNRIADLEDRMVRGDYAPKVKRTVDLSKDPTAIDAQAKLMEVSERYNALKELNARANRTALEKTWAMTKEVANLPRAMMSSVDASAVLRQGGFITIGNPKRAAQSLVPMFKAGVSEESFRKLNAQIANRPMNRDGTYKKAGLFLADTSQSPLSKQEEAMMSEMADKIPWVKISNRMYVAFLNKLRADSFDAMVGTLSSMGTTGKATEAELKAIANYVNVATGRGNLGDHSAAAEALAVALFSPRLWLSRIQLLAGQPLWKGSARTRLLIGREYAKAMGGAAVIIALGSLMGASIEWDEKSTDFLKLKFGNTRIDPFFGLLQNIVLASRLYQGKLKDGKGKIIPIRDSEGKVPYKGKRAWDLITQMVRSKAAPVPGAALNIMEGRTVIGEETNAAKEAVKMVVPLSMDSYLDAWGNHGLVGGTMMAMASFFGAGLQHYANKEKTEEDPYKFLVE